MAVDPLSRVNAFKLIESARKDRLSLHDTFPESQYAIYERASVENMVQQFGVQYLNYLETALKMEKIRNACRISAKKLQVEMRLRNWTRDLAALSMDCLYPMELTSKVFLQAFALNKPLVRLSVESPTKKNHAILISGEIEAISRNYVENEPLEQFLGKIKDCSFIDPYLNEYCRQDDFYSSPIYKHLRNLNIKTTVGLDYVRPSANAKAEYSHMIGISREIEAEARRILNSPENTNAEIQKLERVIALTKPIFLFAESI